MQAAGSIEGITMSHQAKGISDTGMSVLITPWQLWMHSRVSKRDKNFQVSPYSSCRQPYTMLFTQEFVEVSGWSNTGLCFKTNPKGLSVGLRLLCFNPNIQITFSNLICGFACQDARSTLEFIFFF